jgi:regulator of cell morphogenesis and NO signaling
VRCWQSKKPQPSKEALALHLHWYTSQNFVGEITVERNAPNSEHTVREVALAMPMAVPVFAHVGIDFSCGGDEKVSDACRQVGLTPEALWALIEEAANQPVPNDLEFWHNASPVALMDHIVHRYHEPLRKELQRLESLVAKVITRHGEAYPQVHKLGRLITALGREMELHMVKEERVLFPLIKRLDAALGRGMTDQATAHQLLPPLRLMLSDHDGDHGAESLRCEIESDGYSVPAGVSASYHLLCSGLRGLQQDVQLHLHLENNVLFGAARDIARRQWSVASASSPILYRKARRC